MVVIYFLLFLWFCKFTLSGFCQVLARERERGRERERERKRERMHSQCPTNARLDKCRLFYSHNPRKFSKHIFQISMLLLLNLCLNLDHFAVCDDEMICFGNEIYILHRFHTYFSNFYAFIAKLVSESRPFCSL